jgi:hypothetical protein
MSVSYPITLPFTTKGARRITIRPQNVVGVHESPYTLQDEVQVHPGQRLRAAVEIVGMARADAAVWIAALMSLKGRQGTFYLGDTAYKTSRGVATGTPLVMGASQTGSSLITDGWTTSQTGIVKAGDWLQIGTTSARRLHMVLIDANSNGSGQATLELWPNLREAPADNAVISVTGATGVFRLTGDPVWVIDEMKLVHGLSFEATEVI